MKFVRALLATAAAVAAAAALQVTTAPAASAHENTQLCVACWNSTTP